MLYIFWKVKVELFARLKVAEIFNFCQDDLMTEDIFILDCHSNIFVWVGQQVDSKNKMNALKIGEVCFQEQEYNDITLLSTGLIHILIVPPEISWKGFFDGESISGNPNICHSRRKWTTFLHTLLCMGFGKIYSRQRLNRTHKSTICCLYICEFSWTCKSILVIL